MYRQSKPKGSSLWWCSSLFGLRYIFIYLYCYSWLYVFIKNFAYFLAKVWYEYHFLFLCSTGNKYSSLKGKIFYFISSAIRLFPAKPLSRCATAKYALVSNCSGFQRGADAATQKGVWPRKHRIFIHSLSFTQPRETNYRSLLQPWTPLPIAPRLSPLAKTRPEPPTWSPSPNPRGHRGERRSMSRKPEAGTALWIPRLLFTGERPFFAGSGDNYCKVSPLISLVWISGIELDLEADEVHRAVYISTRVGYS